ncbi:MAG: ATP-dependent DNA helicase [Desulfobacterales bacterium]|nr:ATP-dependent DNA helicase [Desulfobacterales bacterium]
MTDKTTFRVSVRDLAASVCQPDSLSKGFAGRNRAMEGIREHTRLQNTWPEGWQREVQVSIKIPNDSFDLEIFGRMDGCLITDTHLAVEEIKTCRKDPSVPARDPDLRHLAQLKCYGYMAAREHKRQSVELRLTYARPSDGDTATFELPLGIEALEDFFNDLVSQYIGLLGTRAAWERIRNQSLDSLPFPYEGFRDGQRDLAEAAYKVVKHRRILFARAPTGTGKTMATLFPAVKAMGLGHTDKIFYLTAKSPGRTVAQKAVKDLARAGARLKCVTITAKQKTCFTPDIPCDMETCSFALGYYVKLARALAHAGTHDHFDQARIEEMARKFDICPFELSLDLSLNCDIIICDLNYAFDPRVYLKRFFDRNIQNLTFLMDEAHNLPDRLRSMYSAELSKTWILAVQEILRDTAAGLSRALVSIHKEMVRLKKRHLIDAEDDHPQGFRALTELPDTFMETLDEFAERADIWLDGHPKSPLRETVLDAFYTVNGFLNMTRYFGENYRLLLESDAETDLDIRLFCMDPSPIFAKLIRRCETAILFSATFFPFPYYAQVLLGITPEIGEADEKLIPHTIALPSPFSDENFRLLVHPRIKTTYRQRSRYYKAVADIITRTITCRPGNYLIFFSSYAYMASVLDEIDPEELPADIQIQTQGMSETERADFLDNFTKDSRTIGFAVMGGIFGEGIDLTGDRLIGVIVVGVGLPQVSHEQNEIRSYYDTRGQDGFFFAYQMPGFSRVLQATGRLIRSHDDRGVAQLLDERFLRPDYQSLFPAEWSNLRIIGKEHELDKLLEAFWDIHC